MLKFLPFLMRFRFNSFFEPYFRHSNQREIILVVSTIRSAVFVFIETINEYTVVEIQASASSFRCGTFQLGQSSVSGNNN
jgi:ribosomal protein S8E